MPKKITARKHLTLADRIKLYEFMKTLLEKDGEHVAYTDDWSDEKVAQKFSINVKQVAAVRVEMFGKLSNARGDYFVPYPKLIERVATLEKMVGYLAEQLNGKSKVHLNASTSTPYTNGHSNHHRVGA